ncbi:MAG: hypothetical protein LAP38_25055 [Acidobacteriia bacterium]|nr:hypothetical protein [Terriglobia bacterium]
MNFRRLCFVAGLTALASLAQGQVAPHPALAVAKSVNRTWTPPRTADGHPDLQGVWSNNNATPLERPKELAGRALLTDQEVAAMKKKAAELYNGKGDAAFGDTIFETVWASLKGTTAGPHVKAANEFDSGTGDYSSEWIVARDWDNRTSLITDPPDGRMPPMTPEAQKRRAATFAASTHPAAGPEDRGLSERCITFGSPQLTAGYQSYTEVLQSPHAVVVMTEMIHDARVIPLNGGPHLPSTFHQWQGDSRGHWEGDTLVVDTTNYKSKAFMSMSSEKLHVIERFSRTGPETLQYEITIDDPDTWTKPWSLMIPLRSSDHPIYEYACHEGNIGLAGILAGARAEERAAAGSSNQRPK